MPASGLAFAHKASALLYLRDAPGLNPELGRQLPLGQPPLKYVFRRQVGNDLPDGLEPEPVRYEILVLRRVEGEDFP